MNEPIKVSDDSFQKEVVESSLLVLVDFWAPWCGPCRMIAPTIEEISREFAGKVKVAKLNTDENPTTAMSYNIMGIPTLGIFVNGKLVDQIVGAYPKSHIVDKLNYFLGGLTKN